MIIIFLLYIPVRIIEKLVICEKQLTVVMILPYIMLNFQEPYVTEYLQIHLIGLLQNFLCSSKYQYKCILL